MVQYPQEIKKQAVIDLRSRKEPANKIAQAYGVTCEALYVWKKQLPPKRGDADDPVNLAPTPVGSAEWSGNRRRIPRSALLDNLGRWKAQERR